MLFQCWASAVGGGSILEQHWVKSSYLLGSTSAVQSEKAVKTLLTMHLALQSRPGADCIWLGSLSQCWVNDGPPSTTLAQHCPNIGSSSRVCSGSTFHNDNHLIITFLYH